VSFAKGEFMKPTCAAFLFSFFVTAFAHASGAVDYTCAGYVPNTSGGQQTQQSISFTMTYANHEVTLQVLGLSLGTVDPKTSFLTVDSTCKFNMTPDDKYPAYRISIDGKCGTTVPWNFKGMCFFDI
jgi:hypothetical protein